MEEVLWVSVATISAVGCGVGPDDLLAAAAGLRAALSAFDPGLLLGPECVRVAAALAETERTCAAVRLITAARAVDSGAHLSLGHPDGAAWLALQSGSTVNQARRDLDVADRLEDFPATRRALLCGEISKEQATLIVESAADKPERESVLLREARHSDLSKLRDKARDLRQSDTPPEDLHVRQQKARSFRHWRDDLGMVCFSGKLTPEVGVPLMARVEQAASAAKRQARAASDSEELEKWAAYAADAFAQICSPTEAGKRAVRAELVIVCDLFAWRRGHGHPGEACHIIGGGPVPVDLAKELSRDAFVKAVLHDGVGIHTVKHFGRRFPAALRTALDLGPVPDFTGRQCARCGSRWKLEYDHIDPVDHRGPTSYDNIQPLCWADHQAKTREDREAGLIRGPDRRNPPGSSSAQQQQE